MLKWFELQSTLKAVSVDPGANVKLELIALGLLKSTLPNVNPVLVSPSLIPASVPWRRA
jgi:hypothetical protein